MTRREMIDSMHAALLASYPRGAFVLSRQPDGTPVFGNTDGVDFWSAEMTATDIDELKARATTTIDVVTSRLTGA